MSFLAIFISNLKKDWVKLDGDFSGRGMKNARNDYQNESIRKWSKNTKRVQNYLKEHPECDSFPNEGQCMIEEACFRASENRRYQKKRKKKHERLWKNCIPLSCYREKIIMSQELVNERRKLRYEEGKKLIKKYYFDQNEKKETILQTVYKDATQKCFYGKLRELKLDVLDCECEAQTINHLSTVDGLDAAVEVKNLIYNQILKQSSAIESNDNLVDGTICLASETDLRPPVEEVNSLFSLGRFYNLREIASISPIYRNRTRSIVATNHENVDLKF
jgi:hypothetical protein